MNSIYLALDFKNWSETEQFIRNHQLTGVPVKIGMELFYREGAQVVYRLKENGHPIFLDLKLHDIPTTVNKAMHNVAALGVDMVTIHASGGSAMIHKAKEGLTTGSQSSNIPKLLAVTVLTSMTEEMIENELNITQNIENQVISLTDLAFQNGADGVVCSVAEAASIKSIVGKECLTVTPGIRLKDSPSDDQARIATPEIARQKGADVLVVGRAVTQAENPFEAYRRIEKEWKNGKSF
ncbi:Orotidine-5'-phosphate decarboxylase [Lentibacillus sp. JNUCC-1]|uniref:orotidine-5'-phosphate decarboxylase n=1 Tax=Lentibacillus sp. JNUCC-1 TaxID=2654513 RepID=UPI0012E8D160|nr:orotidine-5'-phosphate decarboxylase [Lentibacillus sp. JNUCC-1]MUV40029.1 Orotidine-5'-phosphate decarboxylase [Lentibacillus sp. JNUCC-1]